VQIQAAAALFRRNGKHGPHAGASRSGMVTQEELEANKRLIRRFVQELWNEKQLHVADEIFTQDCVPHTYTYGGATESDADTESPGRRGTHHIKAIISSWRAAFPDWRITIDDLFAEGDRVVLLTTGVGTHRAELMGVAATNKRVTFSGMRIFRIAEGRIAEYWVLWDWLGLWRQIGAMPGRSTAGARVARMAGTVRAWRQSIGNVAAALSYGQGPRDALRAFTWP
jgi:predicted ester cyclase